MDNGRDKRNQASKLSPEKYLATYKGLRNSLDPPPPFGHLRQRRTLDDAFSKQKAEAVGILIHMGLKEKIRP